MCCYQDIMAWEIGNPYIWIFIMILVLLDSCSFQLSNGGTFVHIGPCNGQDWMSKPMGKSHSLLTNFFPRSRTLHATCPLLVHCLPIFSHSHAPCMQPVPFGSLLTKLFPQINIFLKRDGVDRVPDKLWVCCCEAIGVLVVELWPPHAEASKRWGPSLDRLFWVSNHFYFHSN